MYRFLAVLFSLTFFALQQPANAGSGHVVEIGTAKKASLEVIGKAPPKRHIELDLGGLRTDSARLPDGERDLKARIRLRNRRALERLKAGANKKKNAAEKTERAKKEAETAPEAVDASQDAEAVGEDETGNQKVANAKKTKVTRSYKKNKKKRRKKKKGKVAKKLPPMNPGATKPVAIE